MKKSILLLSQFFVFLFTFCQQFSVSYSKAAFDKPFSGKVFLYFNKDNREPRSGAAGIESFPCFAIAVKHVQPGQAVVFDDKAISYPAVLSDLERNEYYVQAVWDRDLGGRAIAESPGNIYSKTIRVKLTKDIKKIFSIQCTEVITEKDFKDTKYVKELKVLSPLLSAFHHRSFSLGAAVILPKTYYEQPQKKYPVVFTVFGYGGDYHTRSGDTILRSSLDSLETITVYLDGNCQLGHSVYANSDNNGPWGDALVKEFIPELEKQYRCDGARLLRGHSSGGWTVLWLQTHYPSVFTACWSSSPDPVDFRDFQKINLYEGDNLYYAKDSSLRMVATIAGRFPWVSMKQDCQMEHVVNRGEQMHSFDAVFSGKGADGNPETICDPMTGEVNKKVFEHWKNYDISLYLRTNWDKLQKDLYGKIRVSVGEQDNFYLNSAVHLLDTEMKKLNTGFVFEYYPGDHFTVSTPEYRKAAERFLVAKYLQWQKENKKGF
jgi:S-formylglutathione hydrolase FrmB